MQDIFDSWRDFHTPNNTHLLTERLEEAITRRQFLKGGAVAALILTIMGSNYFSNLPDDEQEDLIEAPPQEWLDLEIDDPEYQKAVAEYYSEQGDFHHPQNTRPDLSGMSDAELKTHMRMAANKLMIAPEQLPSGTWREAPVFQSETFGYYAFASEGDMLALEEETPGFDTAVQDDEKFFEDMPLTVLFRYTYGQQAFFSYTSAKDADAGKLFDTIELNDTNLNPLTGKKENIIVKKLPLAWTVANKVLIDRVTIMHAELEDPELTQEQYKAILEKHGVTATYYKRKKMNPDQVVVEMIKAASNAIKRMDNPNAVPGKHSNKGTLPWIKENLQMEKTC